MAFGATSQPRIFYSDVDSGPNAGGENNRGAYVTIYGKGFGSSQGSSFVTVGGGTAAAYPVWTDTKIAFQIGSAAQTGVISVNVAGNVSNGIPFTVRSGQIYFVASSGSDANAGSVSAPWATITHARDAIAPGDIVYVRNGFAATGDDGSGWGGCLVIGGNSGTPGNPKALVVYPGESATIGNVNATSAGGCDMGIRTKGQGEHYWTIAGFNLRGAGEALDIYEDNNWRIIGNDMSCPNGNDQAGCLLEHAGDSIYIYGNNIHHVATNLNPGSVTALYHGVYLSDNTSNVWFGWNTIAYVQGCRGLQQNSNSPAADAWGLHIHDNVIHDTQCDGIVMTTLNPAQGTVELYNNIIYNAGLGPNNAEGSGAWSCMNLQGYDTTAQTGSGVVEVYNNTMYNCGKFANPPYAGANAGLLWVAGGNSNKSAHIRDNIFYMPAGVPYVQIYDTSGAQCGASSNCSNVSGSNNLFYGNGPAPANSNIVSSMSTDPMFVNAAAADFHVSASSPAITGGVATPDLTDFDGVILPSTLGYPVGAYAAPGTGGPSSSASITLTPATVSLGVGAAQQFNATVSGSNNTAVTWSMSPSAGTLSASGLYTAPATVAAQQTVVITATSAADSSKTATAVVTLLPIAVTISPSVTLAAGQSNTFAATVSGTTKTGVTWSMSPQAGTLTSAGVYTAPASIMSQQTVTIKATSLADSTKSATATVTLVPPASVNVTVSPGSVSLSNGQQAQFQAAVSGSAQTATWSMSPQVGTLTSGGLYSAPANITQNMVVTVTATVGAKSASAVVTLTASTTSPVPSKGTTFSASISASGSIVAAQWTAPANKTSSDWIALTSIGAPGWWTVWSKNTGGAASGSASIPMPTSPGIYELRYYSNGGYTILGRSNPLGIANTGYSVKPTATTVKADSQITFSFTAGAGRTSTDYVGLYPVGGISDAPAAFIRTGGTASGTKTLTVPSAGTYELRYIMGSSTYTYLCATVSGTITAQ